MFDSDTHALVLLSPSGAMVGHYAPGDPTSNITPPGGPDFQAIVDRYLGGEREASDPVMSFLAALNSREQEHTAQSATPPSARSTPASGSVALAMDPEDINAQTNLALTAHNIQKLRQTDEDAEREQRQKIVDLEREHPELANAEVPISSASPNNPGGKVRQNRITGEIYGATDVFGNPIDLNDPDAVTRQTRAAQEALQRQPFLDQVRQTSPSGFWRGGRMPRFGVGGVDSSTDPDSPQNRRVRRKVGEVDEGQVNALQARIAYLEARYGVGTPMADSERLALANLARGADASPNTTDFDYQTPDVTPALARGGRLPRFALGGYDLGGDDGTATGGSIGSGGYGSGGGATPTAPTTPDAPAAPTRPIETPAAPSGQPPPSPETFGNRPGETTPNLSGPDYGVQGPADTAADTRLADIERQTAVGLRDIEQARNEMLADVARQRRTMEAQTQAALADIEQKRRTTDAYYTNQEAGIDQAREAARKEFEAQMVSLGTQAQTGAIDINTQQRQLAARNPYIVPPRTPPVTIGAS